MKPLLMFASVALAACSSSPPRPIDERYARQSWAAVSVQQADAECDAAVAANPLMSHYQCMRARGWEER